MAEFWHEEQQREEAEVLASIYGDRLCSIPIRAKNNLAQGFRTLPSG